MKRLKIASHQLLSEVNPDVILEFTISGTKPDKAKRGWTISKDTPNYDYYDRWMNKHRGSTNMTYSEYEQTVKELGKV
ncbi:hypothetical protein [Nostoc sp. LEGE 12450]|uniref:hypothetical protein n=1 Tax=Nostoc sp. LEGE 12450 TaxID=1828643 RepID=UPI00187ECEE8|nr:hypothetical protein [Nostoc sp. LEGE 12450]MBE8985894.1 hypothetical protein [Nostoc sp. LEGE 12450]